MSLSRRQFLALSGTGVVWVACGKPQPSAKNNLSLIRATIELAVGDRRLAVALFVGERPVTPSGAKFMLSPPGRPGVLVKPSIQPIQKGLGGSVRPDAHVDGLYVVRHDFDKPGRWVLRAEFNGGKAIDTVEVLPQSASPGVGQKAIASQTPTVDDSRGVDPICTRDPMCTMHEMTIAQAISSGRPSLIAFATPRFCESRTCGPAIDVIEEARATVGDAVNFVHVEIYTDTTTAKITAAVDEWKLPGEPWVVFAKADGTVAERWSGAVGRGELADALPKLASGTL